LTLASSVLSFLYILPKIIFLMIVLLTMLFSKIVTVGMAVALFFFMLIPIHVGIGLSQNSEQQLCILLC